MRERESVCVSMSVCPSICVSDCLTLTNSKCCVPNPNPVCVCVCRKGEERGGENESKTETIRIKIINGGERRSRVKKAKDSIFSEILE